MAIVPDTKDWTWVLTRPCPECGFDARTVEIAQAAPTLRDYAASWQQVAAAPGAQRRREPDRWSPLEYACHITDVCIVYLGRIDRMLTEIDPLYQNWDQDATAIEHRYDEQLPPAVGEQLAAAAAALAERFEAITPAEWQRPGRRSDGASFTVESIVRYFLHDLFHHLWDVDGAASSWPDA